jgi:hypothetical protein
MGTVAIISADEVAKLVPAVVSQSEQITVSDSEDYEMACSFLTLIATRKKQVGETFDPIVAKAHSTWKEACAQREKFLSPLNVAEQTVKSKVTSWRIDEEKKRREEEARLQQIAKQEQDERALAEAAQLEANGEKELADIVLQEAASAPAPVVVAPVTVPKQDGIAKKTNWKWRYKNGESSALIAMVKAAAADPRLIGYLCFNETAVGATVRAQKSMTHIPGIETYPEESVSVRAR